MHCISGPTGPVGPIGPTGSDGGIGPPGPAGMQGPTGSAGGMGPAGPIGATGEKGATGEMGVAGSVGPAGPAGSPGPPGSMGDAGPVGPTGPASANPTFVTRQFISPGLGNGDSLMGSVVCDTLVEAGGYTVEATRNGDQEKLIPSMTFPSDAQTWSVLMVANANVQAFVLTVYGVCQ